MCKWHVSRVGLHVSMAKSSTDLLTTIIILSNSIPTNAGEVQGKAKGKARGPRTGGEELPGP